MRARIDGMGTSCYSVKFPCLHSLVDAATLKAGNRF